MNTAVAAVATLLPSAMGTRPLTTWSLGPVPAFGWRKLSSATCKATIAVAAIASDDSVARRAQAAIRAWEAAAVAFT